MNETLSGRQRGIALAGLFASSMAYAMALNTKQGKRFADRQTWSTVVAGVMLTTGWMALESKRTAWLNFIYFFVAGIPIIVRSLWLQLEEYDRAVYRILED